MINSTSWLQQYLGILNNRMKQSLSIQLSSMSCQPHPTQTTLKHNHRLSASITSTSPINTPHTITNPTSIPRPQKILTLQLETTTDKYHTALYRRELRGMQDLGRIQDYFDCFEDVVDYVGDGEHFGVEVGGDSAILGVYGTHPLKKDRIMELGTIKLQYQLKSPKSLTQIQLQQKLNILQHKLSQLLSTQPIPPIQPTPICTAIPYPSQQPPQQPQQPPKQPQQKPEQQMPQKYVSKQYLSEQLQKIKQNLLHEYHNYINTNIINFMAGPSLMQSQVDYSMMKSRDILEQDSGNLKNNQGQEQLGQKDDEKQKEKENEGKEEKEGKQEKEENDGKELKEGRSRNANQTRRWSIFPSFIMAQSKQYPLENEQPDIQLPKQAQTTKQQIMSNNITKLLIHRLQQFILQTQTKILIITARLDHIQKITQKQKENSLRSSDLKYQKALSECVKEPVRMVELGKWVDGRCLDFGQFGVEDGLIVAKQCALIFGAKQIEDEYTYTVNIIRMAKFIQLGIVDKKYKDNSTKMVYYQNDGCYRSGIQKKKQGSGFKVGEAVSVVIKRSHGTVSWKVGHETRMKLKYDRIKSNDVEWVPYIYLGSVDDAVSIMEE